MHSFVSLFPGCVNWDDFALLNGTIFRIPFCDNICTLHVTFQKIVLACFRSNNMCRLFSIYKVFRNCDVKGKVLQINTLPWRHNDHDSVSNHQPHGCLLNRLFRRRSKNASKLRVTCLCVGNSPGSVNSPHKGPVTRKMLPFDDVIMD